MPEKIDPFIDALIFGTIVSSLDNMGLNPMLVVRQGSRVIAPIAGALYKQGIGQDIPKTLEELCRSVEEFFKIAQTADPDKSKLFYSNDVLTMKTVDCAYLTMADLGKKIGYKACPMCVQAFMLSGLVIAVNLAEIENFQVEHSGDTCIIEVKLIEK